MNEIVCNKLIIDGTSIAPVKIETGFEKSSKTNCGNNPTKSVSNARHPIGKIIDETTSSLTFSACSLLGSPKNAMLNNFVKQRIAIVPTSASPASARIEIISIPRLSTSAPFNIPKYIKNSLINPLNGGKPQIATEPIKQSAAVFGIDFKSPPRTSMFLVWVLL